MGGTARNLPPVGGAVSPAIDSGAGGQARALLRADSAWRAGEYPAATALYAAIVDHGAAPPSVAVFRLATLRSWDNQLVEAIALFRRYVAMEPRDSEGRIALARAISWAGGYTEAIAIYDSIIVIDSTYRDAVLARAQTLTWDERYPEALATYERWLATHPSDREASREYAKTVAGSGRLGDAETLYAKLAAAGDTSAQKGLARVIGWRGELERSEWAWREVLVRNSGDPEALTGLAQVLTWQGRLTEAEQSLEHALRVAPGHGDARTLLRAVRADLRPSVSSTLVSVDDSDRNRATLLTVDFTERAPWNGTMGGGYSERRATLPGIDSRSRSINVNGSWRPGASPWIVRADAGVTRLSSSLAPVTPRQATVGSGRLRVSGAIGRSLNVGAAVSRSAFDETALLIANGIVSSELAGEATALLPARFSLSGGASFARLTGGARENTRIAGSSSLRWTASRRFSLGAGARLFGYDTTSAAGYFAPRRYTLMEVSARGRLGGVLGWNADGDVGLGRQSIAFFGSDGGSRRAERLAASFGYRFDPAREVSLAGNYANVAGPGQTGPSEYRASSIALRARVGF